jgi:hypothetical protein
MPCMHYASEKRFGLVWFCYLYFMEDQLSSKSMILLKVLIKKVPTFDYV